MLATLIPLSSPHLISETIACRKRRHLYEVFVTTMATADMKNVLDEATGIISKGCGVGACVAKEGRGVAGFLGGG